MATGGNLLLLTQGMQVVRLNMSHGDHKSHKAVVDLVKEYNRLNRNCLAIMLDTKGPEVRSGDLTEPIDMKAGKLAPKTVILIAHMQFRSSSAIIAI